MPSVSLVMKRKKLEKVYKSHANDIYRICLYFLKDEKKAQDTTQQVFVEFYKELDNVAPNHIFAYLVQKAKKLSVDTKDHEFAKREVRE